jgi:hypothetical protein
MHGNHQEDDTGTGREDQGAEEDPLVIDVVIYK